MYLYMHHTFDSLKCFRSFESLPYRGTVWQVPCDSRFVVLLLVETELQVPRGAKPQWRLVWNIFTAYTWGRLNSLFFIIKYITWQSFTIYIIFRMVIVRILWRENVVSTGALQDGSVWGRFRCIKGFWRWVTWWSADHFLQRPSFDSRSLSFPSLYFPVSLL